MISRVKELNRIVDAIIGGILVGSPYIIECILLHEEPIPCRESVWRRPGTIPRLYDAMKSSRASAPRPLPLPPSASQRQHFSSRQKPEDIINLAAGLSKDGCIEELPGDG